MNEQEQMDLVARNVFMHHNHMEVSHLERDRAVVALDIVPDSLNPYGALHGGAYYTMADCAGGAACRTDGRYYVTLHGSLDFLHAARSGRVEAEARVRHRGRTTCLVEVEITGEGGSLLARGSFNFFCLGEQLPAAHN